MLHAFLPSKPKGSKTAPPPRTTKSPDSKRPPTGPRTSLRLLSPRRIMEGLRRGEDGGRPGKVRILGDYEIGGTLGRGNFSKVKLAFHRKTGQRMAAKFIRRSLLDDDGGMMERVKREIRFLNLLGNHPHIIALHDVLTTEEEIVMVMEHLPGELFALINEKGKMTETSARRIFQQLIGAVDWCHRHNIVHRDLKPENLLLDANMNVKIGDFGLSNNNQDGDFLKTSCGSPNYAAPEIIDGSHYAGTAVDVWSCGIVLYVLLCGGLPFDDDNIGVLFKKISRGRFSIPPHVSPQASRLLRSMIVVDANHRATLSEIKNAEWFRVDLPVYLRYLTAEDGDPVGISRHLPAPVLFPGSDQKRRMSETFSTVPGPSSMSPTSPSSPSSSSSKRTSSLLSSHEVIIGGSEGGHSSSSDRSPSLQSELIERDVVKRLCDRIRAHDLLNPPAATSENFGRGGSSDSALEERVLRDLSEGRDEGLLFAYRACKDQVGPVECEAPSELERVSGTRISCDLSHDSGRQPMDIRLVDEGACDSDSGDGDGDDGSSSSEADTLVSHIRCLDGHLPVSDDLGAGTSATSPPSSLELRTEGLNYQPETVSPPRPESTNLSKSNVSTLRQGSGSGSGSGTKRPRWHFGIRSKGPPMDIMLEIYRALGDAGFEWREKDFGCLVDGGRRKGKKGRRDVEDGSGDESGGGDGGEGKGEKWRDIEGREEGDDITMEFKERAKKLFFVETRCKMKNSVVRIDIQVYKMDSPNYLVDCRHIGSRTLRKDRDRNGNREMGPGHQHQHQHLGATTDHNRPVPRSEHGEWWDSVKDNDSLLFLECACRLVEELTRGD